LVIGFFPNNIGIGAISGIYFVIELIIGVDGSNGNVLIEDPAVDVVEIFAFLTLQAGSLKSKLFHEEKKS